VKQTLVKIRPLFLPRKVRDVYLRQAKLMWICLNRILLTSFYRRRSDVKASLNQIAEKFSKATSDIVPNWLLAVPDPMLHCGLACKPFAVGNGD
jgi:phosphoribosylaminoimidazole-succinocarboxamide synthase